ncbi:tetratricopeptide repeat protein [Marinobacter sp. CHS3-4]|uniref:tetratricopeptide repeat protein n=1 Tax=Marinobacter sp. CHS3-4 TaxID=3045174 RepID=UPI0024B62859|nr:tetratricopeptide repeat protein [Marinobacter sp. CHS3-4]MDI9243792.1 tetratricopeptide repeat protein [Marinobacter sp. CHS3-4]
MYRSLLFVFSVFLLHGCSSVIYQPAPEQEPKPESNTQPAKSFDQERAALFDQPYIDPLTDYLIEHSGDAARAELLDQVREERDRRCKEVARQFSEEPATPRVLARFNAGYAYSCPEQVAAFESRVDQQQASEDTTDTQDTTDVTTDPKARKPTDQALSDCYLLTTIRNFSAAREACRVPAQEGDNRAQANMALVTHAFEEYGVARQWAEKAADRSGQAAFLLGEIYAKGQGVNRNRDQAVHWYSEAIELGHEPAQEALDQYRDSIADEGT